MKVGKRRGGMLLRQAVSLCLSLSMLVGLCLWALAAPARDAVTEETIATQPVEEPTQQISLEELLPVEEPQEDRLHVLSVTDVAYAVEGGKIYFNPSTGKITDCDSGVTSADIPGEINGVSVTAIGHYAFEDCYSLTSVTIPDSVTSIEERTFAGCNSLISMNIPDSVTSIGDAAFYSCSSLINVTIPDGVTFIGNYAFFSCSSLTNIYVAPNNASYRSVDGILFNKDMKCLIQYPGGKPGGYAIPDSITSIGGGAFSGCSNLTSVTIPDSVITIRDRAFYDCDSLTSVTIPDGVTSIGHHAFSYCDSLTSVTIPDSVTSIEEGTFAGCNSLTSVTIPDSVTYIGYSAFNGCDSLISVTIPDSVTYIDLFAFWGHSLTSAYFMGDAPRYIGYQAFPSDITLYYIDGKDGWTTPIWEDYRTVPILGLEGETGTHVSDYYSKLTDYHFWFTDNANQALTGALVTAGGESMSSGDASELSFAYSAEDDTQTIAVSKPNYHSVSLPLYVLGSYNNIALYPESYTQPFTQAVYGSQNGGRSYNDLLSGGMSFSAGSLDEQTAFYIDVNWGNRSSGKIYLSQTLNPADGFALKEGLNDAQNISMHLDSGSGLYLLMQTANGEVFTKALAATITEEDVELDVDFGNSVDIDSPNDDTFLSKFELGFKLPKNLDVSLSVENDGTVLGTIGVKIAEKEDVGSAVKTIKDALYYADNYPKDWDGFVRALKGGSIIPRSSTFGITLDAKVIGYLEGKLVRENDGSYGIQLTDGKLAAKFEGKLEKPGRFILSPAFRFMLEALLNLRLNSAPVSYPEN